MPLVVFGHQHLDVAIDQIQRLVAEHRDARRVDRGDGALRVDGQHRIDQGGQDHAGAFLGPDKGDFGVLPDGDFAQQGLVGFGDFPRPRFDLAKLDEHARHQAGKNQNIGQALEIVGEVEFEVEQAPRIRHEHRLTEEADDQRKNQPMLQRIAPPGALAQVSGQRHCEEEGRHELLRPVEYEFEVIGPR